MASADSVGVVNEQPEIAVKEDDLALFPGTLLERWDAMTPAEVVRDALLSEVLSTAICYLRSRGVEADLRSSHRAHACNLFTYVRDISHALAYQAVCQDQIDLALRILRVLGHRRIALHLRQIATLTCRSSVRSRLLSLLEAESDTIDALQEVEPLSFPIDPTVLAYMRQVERL